MQISLSIHRLIRSLPAVTLVAATAGFGAQAALAQAATSTQSVAQSSAQTSVQASNAVNPVMNFRAYLSSPASLPSAPDSSSFSSSSSSNLLADAADPAPSLSEALAGSQPPPRRRYGRPNYADSHTNADGSRKWTFVGGAGFTVPVSDTSDSLTTGYRFQVGGGRNFNKKFGVLLQFDYDHFGFQDSVLNKLLGIYNSEIDAYNAANPEADIPELPSLGGSSHIWSFTLNPIYNISQGDQWGTYVVGGVGFYHKVADFTTPVESEYCDPFYGICYPYQANATYDSYVSNAPGINGGFGVTYKFSRFTSEKLFAEVRYVHTFNSSRPYYDGTSSTPPSGYTTSYFNVFPQNSQDSSYIPVTFGIRF